MTSIDYLIHQTERRLARLYQERDKIVTERAKKQILEFARKALPDEAITRAIQAQIPDGDFIEEQPKSRKHIHKTRNGRGEVSRALKGKRP